MSYVWSLLQAITCMFCMTNQYITILGINYKEKGDVWPFSEWIHFPSNMNIYNSISSINSASSASITSTIKRKSANSRGNVFNLFNSNNTSNFSSTNRKESQDLPSYPQSTSTYHFHHNLESDKPISQSILTPSSIYGILYNWLWVLISGWLFLLFECRLVSKSIFLNHFPSDFSYSTQSDSQGLNLVQTNFQSIPSTFSPIPLSSHSTVLNAGSPSPAPSTFNPSSSPEPVINSLHASPGESTTPFHSPKLLGYKSRLSSPTKLMLNHSNSVTSQDRQKKLLSSIVQNEQYLTGSGGTGPIVSCSLAAPLHESPPALISKPTVMSHVSSFSSPIRPSRSLASEPAADAHPQPTITILEDVPFSSSENSPSEPGASKLMYFLVILSMM